jgi:hypothetical protein
MIELRWVEFGPNRQLEYRTRAPRLNNWGDVCGLEGWSNWQIVPVIDGNEAAYEDLRASGGIVGAP